MSVYEEKKVNILLVDGESESHRVLEALLGSPEYNLLSTRSIPEALELIQQYEFALILIDVHMPEMDGFELASRIQRDPQGRRTPFIMTAKAGSSFYQKRSYALGAVDYLEKPFDEIVVKTKVSVFADLFRARKESERLFQRNQTELEAKVQDRTQELQTLMAHVPVGIFQTDAAGACVFVNERWCDMAGMTADEARGTGWVRALHPDDHERVAREWSEATAAGREFVSDYRFITREGKVSWLHGSAVALLGDDGKPSGFLGTISDITDRKRFEVELENSRQRLELTQTSARIAGWEWLLATNEVFWSGETQAVYGTEMEPSYESFWRLVHPDDKKWLRDVIKQAIDEGGPYEAEFRVIRPDGSLRWLAAKGQVFRDGNGRPTQMFGINMDISERKQAETALKESEANFRLLADFMPQMIWWAGADGGVEFFNQRWVDYTGLTLEQSLGIGWIETEHPEDLPKAVAAWNSAVANGCGYEFEHRIRGKDGTYRWHLCRAVPLRDSSGTIMRWIGSSTDTHEKKIWEEELSKAKEKAEAANQAKSMFLANMSHEIRTPLGAMLGFCELLKDPQLSQEDKHSFIATIDRNGEELAMLIDDILDLSKVEAGHLEIESLPLSLSNLINDVLTTLGAKAREKGIELTADIAADVPETIISDPMRLRQILFNIVGNAIKFTQRGSVQLKVQWPRQRKDKPILAFTVRDSGCGIAPDDQAKLFKVFSQGDNSTTRRFGGSGLGLALSRRLAMALGGDVKLVESHPNRGSTFAITIDPGAIQSGKIAKTRIEGMDPSSPVPSGSGKLEGIKILLADDSPDNRLLISRMLKRSGAQVDVAENGDAAVKKALRERYDLVLMDLQMPLLDGFGATEELRRRGFTKPIIALTAHAMREEREKCFRVGCDDHLTKPINCKQLISVISRFGNQPCS